MGVVGVTLAGPEVARATSKYHISLFLALEKPVPVYKEGRHVLLDARLLSLPACLPARCSLNMICSRRTLPREIKQFRVDAGSLIDVQL